MQAPKPVNEELNDKARRELLAKVYALILADDWEDEALQTTLETTKVDEDESILAEKEATP